MLKTSVLSGAYLARVLWVLQHPQFWDISLLSARVSTRNGKILLTLSTRNIKILNTPLQKVHNLMEQVLHLILPKSGRTIIPPVPLGSPFLFLMINRILAKTDCIISHFHIPGHLGLCSILYMISRIFVCRYFSYLLANRQGKVKQPSFDFFPNSFFI